jgi:hypothetical protein
MHTLQYGSAFLVVVRIDPDVETHRCQDPVKESVGDAVPWIVVNLSPKTGVLLAIALAKAMLGQSVQPYA